MNTLASNPAPRAPVFQSSISGFSIYYAGKAHKFGNNKVAAQAFMDSCKAPVVSTATEAEYEAHLEDIAAEPQSPEQEAANEPTPREMLDILSAENADLREQLKMAKALNAKLAAPKDFSALASDLRQGLISMDARKDSRRHKDGVVAINSVACTLSNNS